jgi:hypothetical protein
MSELREKLIAEILDELDEYERHVLRSEAAELADRILDIPEIREGQYLYSRKKVKAGKPSREPTLGHSIGTRR